jgi:hypothetical protein
VAFTVPSSSSTGRSHLPKNLSKKKQMLKVTSERLPSFQLIQINDRMGKKLEQQQQQQQHQQQRSSTKRGA